MVLSPLRSIVGFGIALLSFSPVPILARAANPSAPTGAIALSDAPAKGKPLRVGLLGVSRAAPSPSGTNRESDTKIECWKELARAMDLKYRSIAYTNPTEAFKDLGAGKLDLIVGNVGITADRIAKFDFTQPVYQEKLTLLLRGSPPTLWSAIRPFLGWAFLSSVGGIVLCITVVGHLLWLAERHQNPKQFPPVYFKGAGEGIWCALVTLTTVGYGDRYPLTPLGRSIIGTWMILSVVVITSLTAGIATTLAVAFSARPLERFDRPNDLQGARIATVGRESASTQWATF
ncbi:transporter substrate-binding domain-containing protein [Pannus brasiliensis CCIBt3594]|uniref:Transporter substrate-binding domain-containing protein n=1 Tax=Pannus brasiliensis CCIBt3594 TaxID=1427578 RepID=A0AAW9QQP0_9CHRO